MEEVEGAGLVKITEPVFLEGITGNQKPEALAFIQVHKPEASHILPGNLLPEQKPFYSHRRNLPSCQAH